MSASVISSVSAIIESESAAIDYTGTESTVIAAPGAGFRLAIYKVAISYNIPAETIFKDDTTANSGNAIWGVGSSPSFVLEWTHPTPLLLTENQPLVFENTTSVNAEGGVQYEIIEI